MIAAHQPADPDSRFHALAEVLPDAVVITIGGRIAEVNSGFESIFGYPAEQVIGVELETLLTGTPGEMRSGRTSTGSMRQLELGERPLDPAGSARLVVLRDVTERNAAQREADVIAYQYAADLSAVADVARRLPRTTDSRAARDAICQALLEVCDGTLAVLMEPDGESGLISTGVAGERSLLTPLRVDVDEAGSSAADVFASGEAFFISDLALHEGLSPRLSRETGVASALWQPVLRDGCVVGVLLVGWDTPVMHLSDRAAAVAGLFAAEAAVAIERADYLGQLEALNRALGMQLESLRVSDQLKTDFVSSVSHELRTPLTAILGYVEILAADTHGEEGEFLEIIDHNARRLEALITDLLTLSGVESGNMALRTAPVEIRALVRQAIQDQTLALNARRLKVVESLPAEAVWADVDAERIGQVLANLLSNAAKFTPAEGRIDVVVEVCETRIGSDVRVTVRDSGIGIPRDDLPRLFERFFRARNATDQAIPGTGLGLAICSAIVEAHKGRMSVESELGRGTAVSFVVRQLPQPPQGG